MPFRIPTAMRPSPASVFLTSVGDPLECAALGATPFLSPIEFLLSASSELRVQHTAQHPADPFVFPNTIVIIEQCLSRAGMNSL